MEKILLIDDDYVIIDLLQILLEIEGFEVVTLPDGEDIVAFIRDEAPKIILMDVYLTSSQTNGEEGFVLLDQIREYIDEKDIKVIMSSGINFRKKSIEKGADAFLQKPYMPEELIQLLNQLLENR